MRRWRAPEHRSVGDRFGDQVVSFLIRIGIGGVQPHSLPFLDVRRQRALRLRCCNALFTTPVTNGNDAMAIAA